MFHVALSELPALCAQDLHHLQHRGGVFELVRAEKRQGIALAFVGKGLAVEGIKLCFDFVKVRDMERNAQLVASFPHDLGHALRLLEEYRVTARLQNTRLLEGDLLDRFAQHRRVVKADVSDDGNFRCFNHVSRIQSTSHADFQDDKVTFLFHEVQHTYGCDQFKLTRIAVNRHVIFERSENGFGSVTVY